MLATLRFHRPPAIFLCQAIFCVLLVTPAVGAQTIIVEVLLNGQPRGEHFVSLTEDGDVLMASDDLISLDVPLPPGEVVMIDEIPHRSLRAMDSIDFELDRKTLSLRIRVDPEVLPESSVDFSVERKKKILYPSETSLFLNYALDYVDFGPEQEGINLTNQLGMRRGQGLFLTDTIYRGAGSDSRFVRLQSSLIIERRERMLRWTAGDFFAAAGELGGRVNLGGISFARRFEINPYFLEYPTASFTGVVPTPSEVDIYLDGARIRTEHLPPGPFELANISRHGGAGLLELVFKDAYGNEYHRRHPFYLAENLLKEGLHEYSYNIGFQREDFGTESFSYGDPALSLFHRYGYSERLTAGVNAEASPELLNLGGETSWAPGALGVFKGAAAGHLGSEGNGYSGLLRYSYLGRNATLRLGLTHYSADFTDLATVGQEVRPEYVLSAGASAGSREFGSLSFEVTASSDHSGINRRSAALTYSRALPFDINLFAMVRKEWHEDESTDTVLLSFNYHPWPDLQVSGRLDVREKSETATLQAQKNPPLGEGYGYRVSLERTRGEDLTTDELGTFAQYNGRHGIYRSDLRFTSAGANSGLKYRLSASGAIARVGNKTALTRPITDSFGLVKVGELEGVRVMHNGQEIGRTDNDGLVFLSNLNSYYENQISISDKDIPLDYSLTDVTRFISPPLRSGACIPFRAVKFQPLVGSLHLKRDGKPEPLEFREVELSFQGISATVPTGNGGEFYLDPSEDASLREQPAQQGGCAQIGEPAAKKSRIKELRGRIVLEGKAYSFRVEVPPTREFFVDLGKIVVKASDAPAAESSR
ncbi:MAG: fimbria/pilus outer membrane usher protein [Desulfuromonadales bacterium]